MRGVLVTGSDTTLGERLVRTLVDDPTIEHVVAVGRRPPEQALPLLTQSKLTYLPVDLSRERRAHDLLFGPARDLGVEVVVHTAFVGSPTESGGALHQQNVEATRQLMDLCERHPTINRFVLRSYSEVYQISHELPVLIAEDHPMNLSAGAPQYVRDRVEADLHACVRMGLSRLQIVVMRCAEVLAPGSGSQLYDYLESPICFRPIGYDPMLNLLSLRDFTRAFVHAIRGSEQGVFNIPGADTLPLSVAITKWGRIGIPVPGSWMAPLYNWRRTVRGHDFRYGMNRRRFHYSGVLDGRRARDVLGFVARDSIDWSVS